MFEITLSEKTLNQETIQTVNARELHRELGVGKFFTNWIKDRINKYGFIQDIDFIIIAKTGNNPNGGRPSKEYYISLDMAKELSMLERNEKGKEARLYFIAMEKKAKQVKPERELTRIELAEENLRLVIESERLKEEKLKAEQETIRRLSIIGNHLAGSVIGELGNNTTFNTAAKVLSTNLEIKLSHNKLMRLCRENGWLMTGKRSRSEYNMPTQAKIHHFMVKLFHNPDNNVVTATPVLRPSGMIALSKLLPIWCTEPEPILPPPPSLVMLVEPLDIQAWYNVGWTDEMLLNQGKATFH